MVAYSFQKQFVGPIINGSKLQTIRAVGKRRHADAGDRLQLYTGMRTKHCKKIIDDPLCTSVLSIRIRVHRSGLMLYAVPKDADDLDPTFFHVTDAFAQKDGFNGASEMAAFWKKHHPGVTDFDGLLISWATLFDGAKS